jgi:hypothetical protein
MVLSAVNKRLERFSWVCDHYWSSLCTYMQGVLRGIYHTSGEHSLGYWFPAWAIWPLRGPRQVPKEMQEKDGKLGGQSNF